MFHCMEKGIGIGYTEVKEVNDVNSSTLGLHAVVTGREGVDMYTRGW